MKIKNVTTIHNAEPVRIFRTGKRETRPYFIAEGD